MKEHKADDLDTKAIEDILLREFYLRGVVLTNVNGTYFGLNNLHECDVLYVTKSGYGYEYEIKISKSDLKADLKKKHKHSHKLIKATTFVVPKELKDFALENVPIEFGVAYVEVCSYTTHDRYYMRSIRNVKYNKDAVKWTQEQISKVHEKGYFRYLNGRI